GYRVGAFREPLFEQLRKALLVFDDQNLHARGLREGRRFRPVRVPYDCSIRLSLADQSGSRGQANSPKFPFMMPSGSRQDRTLLFAPRVAAASRGKGPIVGNLLRRHGFGLALLAAGAVAAGGFGHAAQSAQSAEYRVIARYALGGRDVGYDYLRLDALSHRLFVAHGTRVEVVD